MDKNLEALKLPSQVRKYQNAFVNPLLAYLGCKHKALHFGFIIVSSPVCASHALHRTGSSHLRSHSFSGVYFLLIHYRVPCLNLHLLFLILLRRNWGTAKQFSNFQHPVRDTKAYVFFWDTWYYGAFHTCKAQLLLSSPAAACAQHFCRSDPTFSSQWLRKYSH